MQQWWRGSVHRLVLAGAMGILLVAGGRVLAQTGAPGGSAGFPGIAAPAVDEMAPRLLVGPKGEVLRVWQRTADLRLGGGAALVAVARPGDRWETLLDLRWPGKGLSALTPDLAVGPGNELAVAYQWWRDTPRSKQIRVAWSNDGGTRWTQPPTQLDQAGKGFEPRIAWARDRSLVVVWSDERRGGRLFDVYARRSPDGGATWEPEELLSRFPQNLPNDLHARPRLVSDGRDRLWVVWVGVRTGRSSIYMNRSTDGGRTWTDPAPLTGDSRSVFAQNLLRAGDHMLLVWHDTRTGRDRLYAVSSSDAGTTWTAPVRVDHLPAAAQADASAPTVLLGPGSDAFVAWQDSRNGRDDIFLARSSDGGRSWTAEDERMDMDEPGTAVSRYPKLARAADGRVALAWEDDRDGHEGVYLRVRSAGPNPQWGPEQLVAPPTGKIGGRVPDLAWTSNGLHLAWEVWDYTAAPARISKTIGGRTLSVPATR
jgi:BNR repeat-like domain